MKITAMTYQFLQRVDPHDHVCSVVVNKIDDKIIRADVFRSGADGQPHLAKSYDALPAFINLDAAHSISTTQVEV